MVETRPTGSNSQGPHSTDVDNLRKDYYLDDIGIDDDVLGIYFSEIGSIPLLGREEEIDLAKRYEVGRCAEVRLLADQHALTLEEKATFESQIQDGLAARDRFVLANQRLVIKFARIFQNQGLPLEDLIQEGNFGLLKAVEKFDWRRGYRFSTYARPKIMRSLLKAIEDQSRTIRLPQHVNNMVRKVYVVTRDLEVRLGRNPTSEEIAQESGLTVDQVVHIKRIDKPIFSLEKKIGEDNAEFGYFVPDATAVDPEEEVIKNDLLDDLDKKLLTLSRRERRIIWMRYLQDPRVSQKEISRILGDLTRSRIAQIETRAKEKLKIQLILGEDEE